MYSNNSNQPDRFNRPGQPPLLPGPRFGSPTWRPQNSPFRPHTPGRYSPQQRGFHHQPQFDQRPQSGGPPSRFLRFDSPHFRGHHHHGGGHRGRHSHRGKHHHHHHHHHQQHKGGNVGTQYYKESMVKDPWAGMTPISVDSQR